MDPNDHIRAYIRECYVDYTREAITKNLIEKGCALDDINREYLAYTAQQHDHET